MLRFNTETKEASADTVEELVAVAHAFNGNGHAKKAPTPTGLDLLDPPSAPPKRKRKMGKRNRQAVGLMRQHGITLGEAWKMLADIESGKLTPTGRKRRAAK